MLKLLILRHLTPQSRLSETALGRCDWGCLQGCLLQRRWHWENASASAKKESVNNKRIPQWRQAHWVVFVHFIWGFRDSGTAKNTFNLEDWWVILPHVRNITQFISAAHSLELVNYKAVSTTPVVGDGEKEQYASEVWAPVIRWVTNSPNHAVTASSGAGARGLD